MKVAVGKLFSQAQSIVILCAVVALTGALTSLLASSAHSQLVAGVRLEPSVRVADTQLVLNGAGLRSRFGIEVYVIGIYLAEPVASATQAIDQYGPKRISLTFLRDVSARQLVDALYEGVRDGSPDAEFLKVKKDADALSEIMLPLRTAKKGDTVSLDYLPYKGAQVIVNGRAVGSPVPSHGLYQALLRIWLGDNPIDRRLKSTLLLSRP